MSLSLILVASQVFAVQAAPASEIFASTQTFGLSSLDKQELAQFDKRRQETLVEMKKDPAKAFLLSALYPGLGQLYVGNDNPRSFWIMGGGTLILAGGLMGFALLSNRPEEASSLGNTMITLSMLGYHLWNVRDAYMVATEYNYGLENKYRISEFLEPFSLSYSLDKTPVLSYQLSL